MNPEEFHHKELSAEEMRRARDEMVASWDEMCGEEQDALIASGWHPGPPARIPVDDTLDRLRSDIQHGINSMRLFDCYAASVALDELLARVKAAEAQVEQLREERDALREEVDLQIGSMGRWAARAKAAEAEVRRLREGLREIRRDCAQRWTMDKIDALLAASPDGTKPEGGEA